MGWQTVDPCWGASAEPYRYREGLWGRYRCDVYVIRARKILLGLLSRCDLVQKQLQQGQHLKKRCKLWSSALEIKAERLLFA